MIRSTFYLVVIAVVAWSGWRLYQRGEIPLVGGSLGDARMMASVTAAISLHQELSSRPIRVRVRDGAVTLSGEVASERERTEAETLARSVAGVGTVANELRIAPTLAGNGATEDRSLGDKLDDVALTAKVKAALALHRELKRLDLDVSSRDGTVSVRGQLERPEQVEVLRRWIESVRGVERLETELHLDERSRPIDALAQRIETALGENENLRRYRLRVVTEEESVLLRGAVSTGAERELAGLLAERWSGGRKVINEIEVGADR